jgi:hypothetical protein
MLNPFISYPFPQNVTEKMMKIGVAARAAGMQGLKIYHEIHELSTRSSESELWALLSLGDEVLTRKFPLENWPGDAGNLLGFQWLQEHMLSTTNRSDANYAAAFYQKLTDGNMDQSVRLQPISRMNNWWIESIHYLTTHPPFIDGIYLDGTSVDRWTMKRARKVLEANSAVAHMDFHCANTQGSTYANGGNGSVALRYMTHFPYLSSLWLGEGYWYGQGWGSAPIPGKLWTPEEWLVEVSGLPFGLFGDMLGGSPYENPYQSLVFGMQGRMPQPALYERAGIVQADPRALYDLIDRFDLASTEMCGWWQGDCAIQSQPTATVKATTFSHHHPERTIVVVANFGGEALATNATLTVDFTRIGLEPVTSSVRAPAVYNFQPEHQFQVVPPHRQEHQEPQQGVALPSIVVPLGVGAPNGGRVPWPPSGWVLVIEHDRD